MGIRYQKRIKLLPGLRLNLSARGVGLSTGIPGARVSLNTSGRLTGSVGIPGSGVSYVKTKTIRPIKKARDAAVGKAVGAAKSALGLNPAREDEIDATAQDESENEFGIDVPPELALDENQLREQAKGKPESALLVELVTSSLPSGNDSRAEEILNQLLATHYDPATDPFVRTHLADVVVPTPIALGVTADLPLDRDTLTLLLVEIRQRHGDFASAIKQLGNLKRTPLVLVSLTELYALSNEWAAIVAVTDKLEPSDAASMFLMISRGQALREQGYKEAAKKVFAEVLAAATPEPELHNLARIERGQLHLLEGNRQKAREDFETVLADDSTFPGLTELLQQSA